MRNRHAEEPANLFPKERDAVLYLVGLTGFWGGIGAVLIAAEAAASSVAIWTISGVALGSAVLVMNATRKLEGRISGRMVRPWPFGYASLRTQVIATLPSTVMAAAQRLSLNAVVVVLVVYSLLVLDFLAMVVWSGKR
jgi:hypothetical protein